MFAQRQLHLFSHFAKRSISSYQLQVLPLASSAASVHIRCTCFATFAGLAKRLLQRQLHFLPARICNDDDDYENDDD